MAEQTRESFTEARVIICEGESDCKFLTVLLERRAILGFQIAKPAQGKDRFENRLRTIRTNDDFAKIRTIVLVTDNDDNPKSSFDAIASQVRRAKGYPVPSKPLEIAKSKNEPEIAIIMLPWTDLVGGMETLVLESISEKECQVRVCLDEYLPCTPARSWNANKQSKMLLACMVAAICEGNPVGSLSYLWNEQNNLRPLLDHKCFNQLADFLSEIK